ncbi:MAG TPA: AAA family ATPase, partial [Gemmataceae bacterium]|nr:AAA family ATPase [Gemmataceae bacterium]
EPDELLTLVNAVVKAYEKEVVEAETDRRRKRVKELDAIYVEAGNRLRKKKDSLREMADELGTSEAAALTQKQVTMQAYLGELKKQHAQARAELMKAKAKLASHRSQEKALTDPPVPEAAVTEVVEADPEVKQHLTRISRLQEVVADYEQRAVNPNETVKLRAERELASLRKKVDGRREQARSALVERLRQKAKADYDAQLAALTSEVELWAQQEKTLRDEVAGQGQETEKVGRSSTAFELLKAEVDREEKLAERVGNEVDILRMELRSPPRVSVFQEAALQKKDAKKQLFATLLAAVAGLAGACFGVGWWESRARRVHTAEEVATGLGLRVVGAVPPLPVPALRLPTVVAEAEAGGHQLLESIDGIRTMLLRDASSSGRRLLLVTSAVSGEGKTTLASHLAGSLARAGRRTLLIDCDLRRPTLHQLFEVPPHPGFSEALLGEVPLAEATRATSVPGLWIMPAGQWDRGVLRALAGEELQKAFATLRQHYDFVVIDSHPVLLATDSLLVGMHADAVILSLMKDVSRVPRASAACQRLADLGIPVLGAVVNGLPEDDYGGAYPYPAAATATAAS